MGKPQNFTHLYWQHRHSLLFSRFWQASNISWLRHTNEFQATQRYFITFKFCFVQALNSKLSFCKPWHLDKPITRQGCFVSKRAIKLKNLFFTTFKFYLTQPPPPHHKLLFIKPGKKSLLWFSWTHRASGQH